MYKLILIKGYTEMHFLFHDKDVLKSFMFKALDTYIPCDEDEADEKELIVKVEKCAEGGNPETAHDENQE